MKPREHDCKAGKAWTQEQTPMSNEDDQQDEQGSDLATKPTDITSNYKEKKIQEKKAKSQKTKHQPYKKNNNWTRN